MAQKFGGHLEGIGQRLRIAREATGLTTRVVAGRISLTVKPISHVTIGNYERGTTKTPEDILEALAQLYERSVAWFRDNGVALQGLRYRALKSVTVRNQKEFAYQSQLWLETYLYTQNILGRNLSSHHTNFSIDRNDSGRSLAETIRGLYSLGDHPLPSTIRLLENFGIYTIQLSTEARIDAFAGWLGDVRVVVLNANLSNDRIRLNALHELAHHLYEDCINGPALNHEEIEKRAFEFASHMLIPEEQLKEAFALKSMVRLVQYKEQFGISLAAMVYRARQSGLISASRYQRLWRDFARLGYRKNEPGHVGPDRPVRMEALIDSAISQKLISYAEIASIAGTDELTVKRRVFETIGATLEEDVQMNNNICFETYKKMN